MIPQKFEPQLQLPHDIKLEQAVLGALLLEGSAQVDELTTGLPVEAFYYTRHRLIYSAILRLSKRSSAIDILTVTLELKRSGELTQINSGAFYISQLTNSVASSNNVASHKYIILEHYMRRVIIESCAHSRNIAFNHGVDVFDAVKAYRIAGERVDDMMLNNKAVRTIDQVADEVLQAYTKRKQAARNNKITGIPSGLTDLDRIIGGWQKSDLVILAARPAMGKSALACLFALTAAKHNYSVLFMSLEMSDSQLLGRMAIMESGVDVGKFKDGYLNAVEEQALGTCLTTIKKLPLTIDERGGVDVNYIAARARSIKKNAGLDLLVVDYLLLIAADESNKNKTRENEVAKICAGLK